MLFFLKVLHVCDEESVTVVVAGLLETNYKSDKTSSLRGRAPRRPRRDDHSPPEWRSLFVCLSVTKTKEKACRHDVDNTVCTILENDDHKVAAWRRIKDKNCLNDGRARLGGTLRFPNV